MKERLKNILKNNYKWIILFICIIIVMDLIEDIFEYEKLNIDIITYKLVVENMRNGVLTHIFKFITFLGSQYVVIGICILTFIFIKNKKVPIAITLNLIISTALNVLLKNIINRPRPDGYRIISETGYSFPSGHSMISMAFYGLILYIVFKNVKNKKIRNLLTVLIAILIFLIGFSRIYLGVHYASDVLGGFIISIAYLILFTTITKTIFKLNNIEEEK